MHRPFNIDLRSLPDGGKDIAGQEPDDGHDHQ